MEEEEGEEADVKYRGDTPRARWSSADDFNRQMCHPAAETSVSTHLTPLTSSLQLLLKCVFHDLFSHAASRIRSHRWYKNFTATVQTSDF